MANKKHLAILKKGVKTWNAWAALNTGKADLREADLSEVNLKEADLRGADLREANLRMANLTKAKLGWAITEWGKDTSMYEYSRTTLDKNDYIIRTDLSGADLRRTNLKGSDLRRANLRNADLREANLYEAILSEADVVESNFRGSDLRKADLSKTDLNRADLRETNLSETTLREADLRGTDLADVILNGADLRGANLSFANLTGAILKDADLRDVNLENTNLSKSILKQANLSKVTFWHTDLSDANLEKAILRGADLREAILSRANFNEADLREVIFKGKDLSEVNLKGVDLRKADLQWTILKGANLSRTNLSGINFSGKDLDEVNLSESTLTNVDFRGATLKNATLTGARMHGTARFGWEIKGVICEYIFFDIDGKEKHPKNRNFNLGEFEKLYGMVPTVEIIFEKGMNFLDPALLAYIAEESKRTRPELGIALQIIDLKGIHPSAVFEIAAGSLKNQVENFVLNELTKLKQDNEFLRGLLMQLAHNRLQINTGGGNYYEASHHTENITGNKTIAHQIEQVSYCEDLPISKEEFNELKEALIQLEEKQITEIKKIYAQSSDKEEVGNNIQSILIKQGVNIANGITASVLFEVIKLFL